jgi:hypothetical protein
MFDMIEIQWTASAARLFQDPANHRSSPDRKPMVHDMGLLRQKFSKLSGKLLIVNKALDRHSSGGNKTWLAGKYSN